MILNLFTLASISQVTPTQAVEVNKVAVLSVQPPTQKIKVGETTTAKIYLETNGQTLYSAQVKITYNPDVVEVVSIKPGNFFTDIESDPLILNQSINETNVTATYSFNIKTDQATSSTDGAVAELTFKALAPGYSIMHLPMDSLGNSLINVDGDEILASTETGLITVEETPVCDGDFNGDLRVNIFDFLIFSRNYQSTAPDPASVDLNSDGKVDIFDLLLFSKNYGTIC